MSKNHIDKEKALQEKRDRRRFLNLGLLIGMLIGVPVVLYFLWVGADEVSTLALGITLLLIFVGLQLFLIVRYRDKILSYVFGKVKANNEVLVEVAVNAVDAFRENAMLLLKGIVARYSWMRFQRWMFSMAVILVGGFAGLLGSVLLLQQIERLHTHNERLKQQNELLTSQNEKFDQQNKMFNQQTILITEQTGLLGNQNSLFTDQNLKIDAKTGLLRSQDEKFGTQNEMFAKQ